MSGKYYSHCLLDKHEYGVSERGRDGKAVRLGCNFNFIDVHLQCYDFFYQEEANIGI